MPRKKFVAGNWKMYTSPAQAKELAAAVAKGVTSDKVTVAVCPPFPWLLPVGEAIEGSRVVLSAQDCHYEKEGAFTGSVAPRMLLEAGCKYVIVGHSERRHGLNESDELLNKKAKAALAAGLEVIFCIGELLAEREANRTESVLHRQLTAGLAGLTPAQMAKLAVAYEPVWAIGTGKVATDQQAQDAHAFVRRTVAGLFGQPIADGLVIQYGGSVKPDNAVGLMAQPDVDGALVGGASLKADSFLAIVKAAG
jgi:triosephosphate isomerase (TIM)